MSFQNLLLVFPIYYCIIFWKRSQVHRNGSRLRCPILRLIVVKNGWRTAPQKSLKVLKSEERKRLILLLLISYLTVYAFLLPISDIQRCSSGCRLDCRINSLQSMFRHIRGCEEKCISFGQALQRWTSRALQTSEFLKIRKLTGKQHFIDASSNIMREKPQYPCSLFTDHFFKAQ